MEAFSVGMMLYVAHPQTDIDDFLPVADCRLFLSVHHADAQGQLRPTTPEDPSRTVIFSFVFLRMFLSGIFIFLAQPGKPSTLRHLICEKNSQSPHASDASPEGVRGKPGNEKLRRTPNRSERTSALHSPLRLAAILPCFRFRVLRRGPLLQESDVCADM